MDSIRDLVKQAQTTGLLTIEAEGQLRQLLRKKYELDDLRAFMTLQLDLEGERVKQESRERKVPGLLLV